VAFNVNFSFADYTRAPDAIFFGDRPLANPGYSAFTLSGSVGNGDTYVNDPLDVLRIEQRLKYLGFDNDTDPTNAEFIVDGKFGKDEEAVLLHFEKITFDGSTVRVESKVENTHEFYDIAKETLKKSQASSLYH
jgi:hypothetical protein